MNEARFLTSPRLAAAGFKHAFFTRQGGVSAGPYASLNFSFGVGDDSRNVEENLRRAGICLGAQPERICFVSQVHGRAVVELDADAERKMVIQCEADAVLAKRGTLACAVRTADCVPVLIADSLTGAVVAVHSGWRGTVANIVASSVERLCTDPSRLIAAIGPHISPAAFEVGVEVAAQLQAVVPAIEVVRTAGGDKPRVDLRAIVTAQLEACGVPHSGIDQVPGCTFSEPERFFSFRRDGQKSGRLLSAIVPRHSR